MVKDEFCVSMKIKNVSGRHPYVEEQTGSMPVSSAVSLLLTKYSGRRSNLFTVIGRELDISATYLEAQLLKLKNKEKEK